MSQKNSTSLELFICQESQQIMACALYGGKCLILIYSLHFPQALCRLLSQTCIVRSKPAFAVICKFRRTGVGRAMGLYISECSWGKSQNQMCHTLNASYPWKERFYLSFLAEMFCVWGSMHTNTDFYGELLQYQKGWSMYLCCTCRSAFITRALSRIQPQGRGPQAECLCRTTKL